MLDALNCCCIGPYKAGEITSITEAALRGRTINISTNKQVFVPPEPLLNAIVIFPDMIPVFTSKISEGISGQLLTLLDKGKIRVGLAKFAEPSATKAIKDWIVSHGMEKKMFIEDGRLGYEGDMIAVGAIHKVINELTDPAFRDRFIIVYPERENWQKGLIQRTVICDIKYTFTRHASVILQELTEIKKECVDAGQKDYELWRVIRDRINTYMEKKKSKDISPRTVYTYLGAVLCRMLWMGRRVPIEEDIQWVMDRIERWEKGRRCFTIESSGKTKQA